MYPKQNTTSTSYALLSFDSLVDPMHLLCRLLFSWLYGNWDDTYVSAECAKHGGNGRIGKGVEEGGVSVERVKEVEEMPLQWTNLCCCNANAAFLMYQPVSFFNLLNKWTENQPAVYNM